jgi:hypothetical protein
LLNRTPRLTLLETVRAFAVECPAAAGEQDVEQRNRALRSLVIARRYPCGGRTF